MKQSITKSSTTIVTWNVNGIRAVAKKGFFEFLTKADPHILCLQETKAHPDQVPPELRNPQGRQGLWSAAQRPGYSGTATFLKEKPDDVTYGIGVKKFDSEGRFVITDHDDFLLYNVYFPNGGSGDERQKFKMEFLKKFGEHLHEDIQKGREVILVGDYNIAHADIDVYDSHKYTKTSGFLPEERAWFDHFLSLGFVDLFRHVHGDEKHRYTWWSYIEKGRIGNRGWRIDYICATKGLLSRVKGCDIWDDVTGSDHCPVVCELLS